MTIILLSRFCKRGESAHICMPRLLLGAVAVTVVISVLSAWVGFKIGSNVGADQVLVEARDDLNGLLDSQHYEIERVREETRNHLDALALKMGSIQAHLLRLDALGERLVDVGGLDNNEFNFNEEPGQGSSATSGKGESLAANEIAMQLGQLSGVLEDREHKLLMLEDLLMNRELFDAVTPSGRPVEKGWVSSNYGSRTDPFSGKKKFHHGMDFAGERGSDIVAVASGVVQRSEKVSGYGRLIEVRHPDGYTTRYAHNQENLVAAGDMVKKGQVIALLGSSGRSSGPHLHFEVRKNGKLVNPRKFVRAK